MLVQNRATKCANFLIDEDEQILFPKDTTSDGCLVPSPCRRTLRFRFWEGTSERMRIKRSR